MSASFRAVVVDDDGMIQATDELDPYDKNLVLRVLACNCYFPR